MSQKKQPNLISYRVSLHEEPGDKFTMHFDCMAEDDDHAIEQAENAYPGCEVLGWCTNVEPGLYVIYSANEAAINDGAGFWSNEDGWVDEEYATRFSSEERINTDFLPICTGQDAVWQIVRTAKISVEMTVDYILNGGTGEQMRSLIEESLQADITAGMLSGGTSVEVEDYSISVRVDDEEEPSIDEDDIADFIRMRIEDGNLSLEDIPLLMARHGMQDPKQFISEMSERMQDQD